MSWPRGYTDDLYAYYDKRKLQSFHDPNTRMLKAIDSDNGGEIIAVAEYTFALDPEKTAAKELGDPNEKPPADWPQDGNWELRRFFKLEWEKWRRGILAGKPYIRKTRFISTPLETHTDVVYKYSTS
jgi:hypothetical protein